MSDDINVVSLSKGVYDSMRVLFNDTYNRKLSALKMKRTKEMLGK